MFIYICNLNWNGCGTCYISAQGFPIKDWMTIPNSRSLDHGTYNFCYKYHSRSPARKSHSIAGLFFWWIFAIVCMFFRCNDVWIAKNNNKLRQINYETASLQWSKHIWLDFNSKVPRKRKVSTLEVLLHGPFRSETRKKCYCQHMWAGWKWSNCHLFFSQHDIYIYLQVSIYI